MKIDPTDPKVQWAVMGERAKQFLKSDIGDYLLQRAQREESEALEQLKTVAPWNKRKILRLQNDIRVVQMFTGWMAEAIETGNAALEQLREEA